MHELKAAQPSRHPTPTARASALEYLVLERPDLDIAVLEIGVDEAELVVEIPDDVAERRRDLFQLAQEPRDPVAVDLPARREFS